jgi:hypothetical protein
MPVNLAALAQGVGSDPNALVLAINDRLRRISAALPSPVTPAPVVAPTPVVPPAPSGGPLAATATTAEIVVLLNKIEAALIASGIMS